MKKKNTISTKKKKFFIDHRRSCLRIYWIVVENFRYTNTFEPPLVLIDAFIMYFELHGVSVLICRQSVKQNLYEYNETSIIRLSHLYGLHINQYEHLIKYSTLKIEKTL